MANIFKAASNGVKAATAAVVGVVGFEVGTVGAKMAVSDCKYAGKGFKELKNPTPIAVKKKGLFGKKSVVTVNPFTGKVSTYTGNKAPVNKKPVIVK